MNASSCIVHRPAESDPGGSDLPARQTHAVEQSRIGLLELPEDAGGGSIRVNPEPLQDGQVTGSRTDPELELGAADLDPQHPGFGHAMLSARSGACGNQLLGREPPEQVI